jgi:hypothetical protein
MRFYLSYFKFVLATLVLFFTVSCSAGAPVFVPVTAVQNVDLQVIEDTILKTTRGSGWRAEVVKSGVIKATLVQRKHEVTINIEYSNTGYTIKYVESRNLEYNQSKNTIHKNYNRWVNNLDRRIYQNLYNPNANSGGKRVIIGPVITVE